MPEPPRTNPAEDRRLSSGTPELDEMLNGGLMPHRPYLVVGPSGTGKTTLALEFLCEGVRNHEPTLLVTMEEPPNEMRFNHRQLQPELDQVWVFDAIPDVMRYERAPFKDVAQVRDAVPFAQVPPEIRKTPELTSVEITLTALEQTLKMQSARRNYTRLVIDSLTALQYFCMKGIDEVQGAQSFLRFLSDLGPTTLLTVESPLEDAETPERMLARGEIRLFRWELEGATVRAIGVEKFRGSSHDIRLHPYRIGRHGIDINLADTISRDTRRVLQARAEQALEEHVAPIQVTLLAPAPGVPDPVGAALDGIAAEIAELQAARLDLATIRGTLDSAHAALASGQHGSAQASLVEVRALVHQMALGHWSSRPDRAAGGPEGTPVPRPPPDLPSGPMGGEELHRSVAHLARAVGPVPSVSAAASLDPAEPPAPPAPVPEPLPSMNEVVPVPPPMAGSSPAVPVPLPPPAPGPASVQRDPIPPAPPVAPLPATDAPPAAVSFGPTFESLAPPPPDRPVTETLEPPSGTPTPLGEPPRDSPAIVASTAPEPASTTAPPTVAAAPKRRRRAPGSSPRKRARSADAGTALTAVPAEGGPTQVPTAESAAPRKRASRRKKAAPEPSESGASPAESAPTVVAPPAETAVESAPPASAASADPEMPPADGAQPPTPPAIEPPP